MKNLLPICLILLFATGLFAQKLTIKNTVGANLDEFGDYDLYNHSTETDISGDSNSENSFAFGDRFQADFSVKNFDARFRLDMLYHSADDEVPAFLVAPSGYIQYTPIRQLSFIAGTSFYKIFEIPSAYLAAADDTTKYGRLLTDSLGYEAYLKSGDAALFLNGFCGGISSDLIFGQDNQIYLKLATGATMYAENSLFGYALDAGFNFGIKNLFDSGFTAHDFTSDSRKFGVFAGLSSVDNLILNTSFYYNFTLSDYLPEARVVRNGVYEYKKQKTKYALGLTGGYEFEKLGLGVYADIISGLNDEYIDDVKYYTGSTLTKTQTTTIKRGTTIVKYKNGSEKRTDGFTAGAIPFYTQLRLSYDPTDFMNFGFNFSLRTMLGDSSQTWLGFYPRVEFELPSKLGSITTGIRLDMNFTRYDGLSDISVPLSYEYKFKKKF